MKDFEDRIDAYLRNRMSSNQKEAFETEMNHNIELQNQFKNIYELRQGIQYSALADASVSLRDLEEDLSNQEKSKKIKKWILGVLLLVGLIATIYFFLNKKNENISQTPLLASKFDEIEFDKYIYHDNTRTIHTPSELSTVQKTAYNQYSIQSFDLCIPKLQNLWDKQKDTLAYYYLGISYYGNEEYEKAKEILNSSFFADYNKPKK